MTPVLLATDFLLLLLIACLLLYIVYVWRKPELRSVWRYVFASPIGMIAALVFACFALVGVLDSLHFRLATPTAAQQRYAELPGNLYSVLDLLLDDVRLQREKSYSAPFATELYSRETILLPNGHLQQSYPRLIWGGRHLAENTPQTVRVDVWNRVLHGVCYGVMMWLPILVIQLFCLGKSRQDNHGVLWNRLRRGLVVFFARQQTIPWRTFSFGILAILMLLAIVAQFSGVYHLLGTDKVGEDVFYQTVKSIRTALIIGSVTTVVMLPAALLLGVMAGYFRGWVDDLIQYIYTTLNSIPGVLLIASVILVTQTFINNHPEFFTSVIERADMRLLALCLILGVTSWTGLCRLLRGEALRMRELEFVQAARALGAGHFTILVRHLLPNMMHIVIITIVLDFSGLVLSETVLSYVNIGVDPSTYSWGNMINSAQRELSREPIVWWSLLSAFIFMFVLVLAANLLADRIRDAFDPRLAGQMQQREDTSHA